MGIKISKEHYKNIWSNHCKFSFEFFSIHRCIFLTLKYILTYFCIWMLKLKIYCSIYLILICIFCQKYIYLFFCRMGFENWCIFLKKLLVNITNNCIETWSNTLNLKTVSHPIIFILFTAYVVQWCCVMWDWFCLLFRWVYQCHRMAFCTLETQSCWWTLEVESSSSVAPVSSASLLTAVISHHSLTRIQSLTFSGLSK